MSALLKQALERIYPTLERGEGVWLWDTDGKKYLDGSSGAMTANIGHGVAEIAKVLHDQAKKVAFCFRTQFTNQPAEDLAARLVALAPEGISHASFVSSGSEATEHAMRMAIQFWKDKGKPGKTRFLSRERSYHGMTMGALSASGHEVRRPDFGDLLHPFPVVPAADAYRSSWGDASPEEQAKAADAWEQAILAAGADNVAAVIAEPIVGAAGGALVAPPGYFKRLRSICDRHEVLLVMDEVITGMGRTGVWFASEEEGVQPDIITIAKGLSAGYTPMGAVLIQQHIYDTLKAGGGNAPFAHTFSGNPLSAATCLAVLDYVERNDLLAKAVERGAQLKAGLIELARRHPHMADVRGRGLLWGFEFVMDQATREAPPEQMNVSSMFADICQRNGLIVYPAGIKPYNNAVLLAPPLTISSDELDVLLELLENSLVEIEACLRKADDC